MKFALFVAANFLAGLASASAATAGGHGALALAVIVGDYSPLMSLHTRAQLALLLEDKTLGNGPHPAITVKADSVVCQAGDVDLAAFSCTLTFGATKRTGTGRRANELFATLIEAGVQGDGAAGRVYEAVHQLECKVEPAVLQQKSGGGVTCTFLPGPS